MVDSVHRRWRKHAIALAVIGIAVLAAPAAASAMPRIALPATTGAAPAAALATTSSPVAFTARRCSGTRAKLMCLINRERARRGVRPLRGDRRLSRAATRHARDMARRRYFAHQRDGGPSLGARLARAGWRGDAAGETIAYGCGPTGSPRAIVRAWMNSAGHAAILLSGAYGRGGPGLARRAPVRCRGGATWVVDVGRR